MPTNANINIVLSNGQQAGQTMKELQQTANRLNREIKDLTPGSDKWVKKTQDFRQVTGRLGGLRKELKGVNTEQANVLQSFSRFLPFGGQIQGLTGAMGGLRQGVGGVTTGFRTLRGAIISTGIGALLLVIGSLVAMFKSSEEGQDKWNKIMKVTGVIIGNLSDVLASFGEIIYDAIVNPVDAAKKAWEGLKKFFTDPLGTIKEGYEAAKQAASDFIAETEKEVGQAQKVADLEAQTNRIERQVMVERKRIEADIAELRLKARQEDEFSAKQRLQFLNEANQLQEDLLEKDTQVAKNRFEIIKQTNAFSKSTKENLDAQAAAEANLEQVEVTRFNQARQIERERQRIRKEIERDDKAAATEKAKEEAELLKKLDADQKAELESVRKQQEEIAALRQQSHEDELFNIEFNAENEELAIEEAFANRLISEEERQEELYQLEVDRLNRQLQAVKDYYGAESDEAKKAANKIKAFTVKKLQEDVGAHQQTQQQKRAMELAAVQGSLALAGSTFGQLASLYDEGSKEYKQFALIQGQLDTINASLAAYKSTAEIPIVGPALAPFAAAAAFVFGQLRLRQIQNVKKAEYGAVLSGKRHKDGGIMVNAEDGEIILNRNVSRDPAALQMASDLNAMYGGIRFMQAGGPVNPLQPQQTASQAGTPSASPISQFSNEQIAILRQMLNVMISWPQELRVINNVQDTRNGINVINRLEDDAGF